MAITIGKTATVVLNRFCNLVLKPEPVATGGGGGGGFVSGDFNFTDIIGAGGGSTNIQTSPKTGTLFISLDIIQQDGVSDVVIYKNGNQEHAFDLIFGSIPFEYTLSISSGDTLDFSVFDNVPFPPGVYDSFNVVLRNENIAGTLVDSFLVDLS